MSAVPTDDADAAARDSYWRRLARTPMRDLVRGRATGRLDIERLVHNAALPAEISSLIERIVRRTRLWQLERVDVAKELIAHFRDGLDRERESLAGAPGGAFAAATLIHDFGGEKQAAKLIRRAKRRQRPLVWHAWRRGRQALGAVAAFLIVAYTALAIRYWSGEPKITHDYLADLNANAAAVPPEQAAWPIYREALLSLNISREWWKARTTDILWRQPGESRWDETVRFVADNAGAIERLRKAATMRGLGVLAGNRWATDDEPLFGEQAASAPGTARGSLIDGSTLGTVLPYLPWLKKSATLLRADAFVAAAAGDGARAATDVAAMFSIARQMREHDLLINELVALSVVAFAAETASSVVAHQAAVFSDDDLRSLSHAVAAFDDDELRVRIESERRLLLDLLQRVYTDDGRGDGRPARSYLQAMGGIVGLWMDESIEHMLGPASLVTMPGRKDVLKEYDRLLDIVSDHAATPMWVREAPRIGAIMESRGPIERMQYSLIDNIFPAMEAAATQHDLAAMRRDAALIAIGLELFRREHDRWPSTLDELVPSFLPAVPVDRHVGKPIRYRLDERGLPLVYSVGNDRIDDGGRLRIVNDVPDNTSPSRWVPLGDASGVPDNGWTSTRTPTLNADWILYPPVRVSPKSPDQDDKD